MQLMKSEGASRQVIEGMHEAMAGWRPQDYDDHLVVESEHILIAADAHIPKHDENLLESMLQQAYEEGVDVIIWAGDLLDNEEWSSYGIDDPTSSFQRNLRIAGALIKGVDRMGMKQYWSLGNHEQRVSRNTRSQITMEQLALMAGLGDLMEAGSLVVSDNPTVYLPVGNWMVTHPSQYGSYPTVVASKLATRYQANVIAAHEHHHGLTTDETGQFIAISSGGLFDPRKHKYINHQVTSHRAWQRGFVILHNGEAHLYRGEPAPMITQVRRRLIPA